MNNEAYVIDYIDPEFEGNVERLVKKNKKH